MSRPIKYPVMKIFKNMINKIYNQFLIEVLDKPKETQYKVINKIYNNLLLTTYRFRTDSGISYDLEFYNSEFEDGDVVIINDDRVLYSGVDIAFTTTNNVKMSNDEYQKRTMLNEQYELFSRLSFLINEYIKNHPNVNCYIVGGDTYTSNLNIYKHIFKNIFSSDFDIVLGTNPYCMSGNAYYFMKKNEIV